MDQAIIFTAKYLFLAVVLLLGFVWLKVTRPKKIELAAAAILAGVLAYVMMKFAGALYYDPRPFVTQHIKPLVSHGADNGFPSEHTVFTMTLTAVLYFYNKRLAVLSLVFTLAVGIGRILAHVHSPIDVAGGLIIGAIAGIIGYKVTTFLTKPKESS